jgi:MFS family permease
MGGSWLGRLPDVKQHLGLSTSVLGTILLVGAFSGLAAMQLAPMLLRRFGHRAVLGTLAVIYPFVLLLIPLARNAVQLGAALVLWGSLGSLLGVVVNTHAVDVEKAYQRAILSSFHAMYSIGTMIGAAVAGLLASKDISVLGSMAFEAAVVFALVCSTISRLLRVADANPEKMDASIDHLAHHPHRKSWWKGVILLGSLCFVAYMAEGAVADWSSIFMREVRGAASGPAVAAFVAFSACMTIGRLAGDVLTMRFGKILLIRAGAFLASIGLVFGLFVPNTFATIVGFAFVGVGLSIIVPVLFSIAGSMSGGESNAAVTRVSTIAYFGLLVGPSAIGFIADHISLTWALLIPAILLIYVFVASNLLHRVVKKAGIV